METFVTLAISAGLAAVVAGFVSLRNAARTIKAECVTKERGKWRDRVPRLALQVHKAATAKDTTRLAELVLEFRLVVLNPNDPEDVEIWHTIESLIDKPERLPEFCLRVSLLLKHDWERAKWETQTLFGTLCAVCCKGVKMRSFGRVLLKKICCEPKRTSYDEFQKDRKEPG